MGPILPNEIKRRASFFSRHSSNFNGNFNIKVNDIESIALIKLGVDDSTDFDMLVFVKNRLVSRENIARLLVRLIPA